MPPKVFYFALCGHCELFIKLNLVPLIEAKLPGDRVKVLDSTNGVTANFSCF